MKERVPKNKSGSAELADRIGLHVNIIAELQRRCVLPQDLGSLSAEDELFISQFKKLFGNLEILRLQLSQITLKEREYLAEHPGDYRLKRWEVWAISRFVAMYEEKAKHPKYKIDSNLVTEGLRRRFHTIPTRWVVNRVSELRKIAARRFKAAQKL